jgi:hypothetical protein
MKEKIVEWLSGYSLLQQDIILTSFCTIAYLLFFGRYLRKWKDLRFYLKFNMIVAMMVIVSLSIMTITDALKK